MVVKWLLYEESNNAPLVRYRILHTPMSASPNMEPLTRAL